jgi:hypothetical protein
VGSAEEVQHHPEDDGDGPIQVECLCDLGAGQNSRGVGEVSSEAVHPLVAVSQQRGGVDSGHRVVVHVNDTA